MAVTTTETTETMAAVGDLGAFRKGSGNALGEVAVTNG